MTRDEVIARLGHAVAGRGLRLAALFGSGARDALRADSDLGLDALERYAQAIASFVPPLAPAG
jgi:predicted nucleotidyltransferase